MHGVRIRPTRDRLYEQQSGDGVISEQDVLFECAFGMLFFSRLDLTRCGEGNGCRTQLPYQDGDMVGLYSEMS